MTRPTGLLMAACALAAAALYLRSGESKNASSGAAGRPQAAVSAAAPAGWSAMKPRSGDRRAVPAAVAPAAPSGAGAGEVDRPAFEGLYQQGSALAASTTALSVPRDQLEKLVQSLAGELSIATTRARTPTEIQMVGFYAEALAAYRDGLDFWELRRFADRPGEDPSLDALAAKYGIQPKNNISYTATWRGYSNACGTIWAVGNAATAKAGALYNR